MLDVNHLSMRHVQAIRMLADNWEEGASLPKVRSALAREAALIIEGIVRSRPPQPSPMVRSESRPHE